MKINSVHFGDSGVNPANSRKTTGAARPEASRKVDTVFISGDNGGTENHAVYSVTGDFQPRADKIDIARERIDQGEYDTRLADNVAEKVADSPAVKNIVTEVAMDRMKDAGERTEKIEQAKQQVEQGYYDDADVRMTIASRLMEALGLTNDSNRLM